MDQATRYIFMLQSRNSSALPCDRAYNVAFNSAYQGYKERGPEGRAETAHKVALAAVKKKYRKDDKSGKWELAD